MEHIKRLKQLLYVIQTRKNGKKWLLVF